MPLSRLERVVIAAGAVGLGVLIWLIVGAWDGYRANDRVAGSTVVTRHATARSRPHPTARAASAPGILTLAAVRGSCWLVVRLGSATGRRLYSGTLARADTRRFHGRRFWISVGAGSNLDVRFNGQPVRGLPAGTANVALDGGTVRTVG